MSFSFNNHRAFFCMVVLFFGGFYQSDGQNLIPNPKLEDFYTQNTIANLCRDDRCPEFWYVDPVYTNPDYMHRQSKLFDFRLPCNPNGCLESYSGDAYMFASIEVYMDWPVTTSNVAREIFGVPLKTALIPGERYCLRVMVARTTKSAVSTNELSAHFSTHKYAVREDSNWRTTNPAQINLVNNHFFEDTTWTALEGSFIADSAYTYVRFGYFNDFNAVSRKVLPNPGRPGSLYFFDDFSLANCSDITSATTNTDREFCLEDNNAPFKLSSEPNRPDYQYAWWPNIGLNDTTIADPVAAPLNIDTTYYLRQINLQGDTSYDSIRITYKTCYDYEIIVEERLYMPNAFSPNRDGVNDLLLVKGLRPDVFHLQIIDRWGMPVFETNSAYFSWDGTDNKTAEPVAGGSYAYILEYENAFGEAIIRRGQLLIVR